MSRSLLFAFSALLLAPATSALAYPVDTEVRSEVVRYGDLDLNYQPDADVMVHRIHRASGHVCAPDPGIHEMSDRRDAQDCRADAETRAVADTAAPLVSARYYGRTPRVIVDEDGYVVDKTYK